MLIECEQARPDTSFSPLMDNNKRGRLSLSALCNNLSEHAHQLPQSSRVTSPNGSSSSQEQTCSPIPYLHQDSQSPFSSAWPSPSIESVREQQRLPSINDLSMISRPNNPAPPFPSPNRRLLPDQSPMLRTRRLQHPSFSHPCCSHSNPRFHDFMLETDLRHPQFRGYPGRLPSSATEADFSFLRGTSDVSLVSRYNTGSHAERILPCAYGNFREEHTDFSLEEAPHNGSPYLRGRHSSQRSSRVCTNCSISQTRQWVRGESHAWLCHSCGQFWRKNGYPRPRALWNRPTFKRSSRKSKLESQAVDATRRLKGSTRQSVSSSFLNGKKMIQWEIRLPPLHRNSSVRDVVGN